MWLSALCLSCIVVHAGIRQLCIRLGRCHYSVVCARGQHGRLAGHCIRVPSQLGRPAGAELRRGHGWLPCSAALRLLQHHVLLRYLGHMSDDRVPHVQLAQRAIRVTLLYAGQCISRAHLTRLGSGHVMHAVALWGRELRTVIPRLPNLMQSERDP